MGMILVDVPANLGPLPRHPRAAAAIRPLIAEIGRRSGEFPLFLANHLPMVLEAMARLGASPERLAEYAEHYNRVHQVPMPPPPVAVISRDTWMEALGDRSRETDYRDFFAEEVTRFGPDATIRAYMPVLAPGVAASATHGLMRLAYGVMRHDEAEIAIALGYWAATFLPLPTPLPGTLRTIKDPVAPVLAMKSVKVFETIDYDHSLLWRWIRNMGTVPEFHALLGQLVLEPSLLDRMRQASLVLFAGTMTFEALHALTGCHWLRLVSPHVDDIGTLAAHFWEVVLALYPKIGMPDLPDAEALEAMRRLPTPTDAEIAAAAVASNDEHDHSLTFSAFEEYRLTGDPLYRVVAAKRVGLI